MKEGFVDTIMVNIFKLTFSLAIQHVIILTTTPSKCRCFFFCIVTMLMLIISNEIEPIRFLTYHFFSIRKRKKHTERH